MSILFGYHNGKLQLNEQCKAHAPIDAFLKKRSLEPASERDSETLLYLYLVYDRDSTYNNIVPISERKAIVSQELFGDSVKWENIEKDQKFILAQTRLNMIQYSDTEKVEQMVKRKIDEYLEYMNTVTFDSKTHRASAALIKTAKDLLKLHEEVRKMVGVQSDESQRGGGRENMFENTGDNVFNIDKSA